MEARAVFAEVGEERTEGALFAGKNTGERCCTEAGDPRALAGDEDRRGNAVSHAAVFWIGSSFPPSADATPTLSKTKTARTETVWLWGGCLRNKTMMERKGFAEKNAGARTVLDNFIYKLSVSCTFTPP